MKSISYLKIIMTIPLILGAISAQGMRRLTRPGKTLASQLNGSWAKFGRSFGNFIPLQGSTHTNGTFSTPTPTFSGWGRIPMRRFDAPVQMNTKKTQTYDMHMSAKPDALPETIVEKPEIVKNPETTPKSFAPSTSGHGLFEIQQAFAQAQTTKNTQKPKALVASELVPVNPDIATTGTKTKSAVSKFGRNTLKAVELFESTLTQTQNPILAMQHILIHANNAGYVPFVIEESMIPEKIRTTTDVQLIAGSTQHMVQLLGKHDNSVTLKQTHNQIASTHNAAIATNILNDTQLTHTEWAHDSSPTVVIGAPHQLGSTTYRVGYMTKSLAEILFGNTSGIQWIGSFDTAVFDAIKRTAKQAAQSTQGKSDKQPLDQGKTTQHIEENKQASQQPQSPNNDAQQGNTNKKSHEGPTASRTSFDGMPKDSENKTNDLRAQQQDSTNEQRNTHNTAQETKRTQENRTFTEQDPRRNDHNNNGGKNNNTHNERPKNNPDQSKWCVMPTIASTVAATVNNNAQPGPDKPTANPESASQPQATQQPTQSTQSKSAMQAKAARAWTPCQVAVAKYGKLILDAIEKNQKLNWAWAETSSYIKGMITQYNEQHSRAVKHNAHRKSIECFESIKHTIQEFVVCTQQIMNM